MTVVCLYLAPVESPVSNVPIPAASSASSASRGHSPQPQTVTPPSAANVEPVAGAVGGNPGGHPAAGAAPHDDAVLRERLKHMGKSKHCFLTVACIIIMVAGFVQVMENLESHGIL